jgi:hypothetical protein
MSEITGGLRARLIHESLYRMIEDSLDQLGWFDGQPGRENVRMVPEAMPLNREIPLNTIALADFDSDEEDAELGSNLTEVTWGFYVDFYAADKSIGIHLINDVKDILRGRMPGIGRTHSVLEVYDWTLATPVPVFYCDIQNTLIDKPEIASEAWLKNWYSCRFEIVDTYGSGA